MLISLDKEGSPKRFVAGREKEERLPPFSGAKKNEKRGYKDGLFRRPRKKKKSQMLKKRKKEKNVPIPPKHKKGREVCVYLFKEKGDSSTGTGGEEGQAVEHREKGKEKKRESPR